MTLLVTIAFIMAVAGCFIMLELSPFAFLEGLSGYLRPKNHSMKNRIKESKKKKEAKGLKLLFEEVKEILRLTGKSEQFIMLCVLAMILFVLGVMIALTMNNVLMVPVLAVGFALLPFYYVKFTASKHKKQINTELETALSMITTSYLRNKNTIIRAIEENLPYLNPPVSEVFRNFLMEAKLINSNTAEALEGLKKNTIKNSKSIFTKIWTRSLSNVMKMTSISGVFILSRNMRLRKSRLSTLLCTLREFTCRIPMKVPQNQPSNS